VRQYSVRFFVRRPRPERFRVRIERYSHLSLLCTFLSSQAHLISLFGTVDFGNDKKMPALDDEEGDKKMPTLDDEELAEAITLGFNTKKAWLALRLAREQIAANDTGPSSQDIDRKMPALGTSTSASASTPRQDGDGLLHTSAGASKGVGTTTAWTRPSGATVVKNILRKVSERQTMYVTDATVVLPPSRDEEEGTGGYNKILLFGGVILWLVLAIVFGIVFNLQTEPTEYLDLGVINGYCKSVLNDYIGQFESPKECWEFCARSYPDSLVAIDFNNEKECYCQDSCDCMINMDDTSVVYILKNMTYPLDCSSYCPNISTNVSSPTLRLPSLLPTAFPSASIGGDHFVAIHSCYSTFDDAVKYCNNIGRELAHIYSEEENAKALEACGDNTCWIGLVEIGGDASTPALSQNWKWLNGREAVYTNWDWGEPGNAEGIDERYAMMNYGNYKIWHDASGGSYIPLCSLLVY